FTDPPLTPHYTLSLHDALPIYLHLHGAPKPLTTQHVQQSNSPVRSMIHGFCYHSLLTCTSSLYRRALKLSLDWSVQRSVWRGQADRKSTRLNSSHLGISYAVFC